MKKQPLRSYFFCRPAITFAYDKKDQPALMDIVLSSLSGEQQYSFRNITEVSLAREAFLRMRFRSHALQCCEVVILCGPDTSLTPFLRLKGTAKGAGMPWRSRIVNDENSIVMLANREQINMRALCRRFGISAVYGYKWRRAFQEQGEAGLHEKSRRPRSHPEQTSQEMRNT
jgi:hypothetical protein